ncbi:MAG: hypothetical protein J4G05_10830 [Chlorobi bacterium]|nr:hypothetical protein [Chlorobiota bacterium]
MSWKIGVYGSAVVEETYAVTQAKVLGQELGREGATIITGACSGLPYIALKEGVAFGSMAIGFSPTRNMAEQRHFTPEDDLALYNRIEFTPDLPQFDELEVAKKYRNVISTAYCDAGIIISGRWGTLHEFCSLVDYGKVVGVLVGTGNIADELSELLKNIQAKNQTNIVFEKDPVTLVDLIFKALKVRRV